MHLSVAGIPKDVCISGKPMLLVICNSSWFKHHWQIYYCYLTTEDSIILIWFLKYEPPSNPTHGHGYHIAVEE